MKPTTILTALALGLTTPLALAKNCKGGLMYCGRGLLNKGMDSPSHALENVPHKLTHQMIGNYYDQIIIALQENGQPTDGAHVNESTFFCKGDGNIIFQAFCTKGCANGGADHSDYCAE